MYITNQTNYALRILMYCALYHPERTTIPMIANAYRISESHLLKILPILTRLGLVDASRGRKGGITLAREPGEITVGSVVRETEQRFVLAECFQSGKVDCPVAGFCTLQQAWTEALQSFFFVLDRYTLADLVMRRTELRLRLGLEPPWAGGIPEQRPAAVASGAPS